MDSFWSLHFLTKRENPKTVSRFVFGKRHYDLDYSGSVYEGGPKNNRNLNVARELEVVARCAARCRESTQYSSSMPRGVSLG
jgi:hypothetical protein